MLYALLKPLVAALARLLFSYRAVGAQHIPRSGPALLAANHLSVLDPPLVAAGAPRTLHFLAKAELFRVPGVRWLLGRLNAHPVEREGADARALRRALALLQAGQALLVFPEGTRGTEGTLGAARPGAGLLAVRSGAPVVPVYVQGTGRVLPRGATRPRRAPVTVAFGPPLSFPQGRGRARYQDASERIMAAIARLKAEAEGTAGADPARPARETPSPKTAPGAVPAGQLH